MIDDENGDAAGIFSSFSFLLSLPLSSAFDGTSKGSP